MTWRLACAVALAGLLGLELRAGLQVPSPEAPTSAAAPVVSTAAMAPSGRAVDSILARPLFAPGRHPPPTVTAAIRPPRLAGLVLAPSMALALLQTREVDGARPVPVGPGGEVSGWRVVRIDATGVLVTRAGQRLQLTIRQAGARLAPPTPIDRIVLMPDKRINPQLAW